LDLFFIPLYRNALLLHQRNLLIYLIHIHAPLFNGIFDAKTCYMDLLEKFSLINSFVFDVDGVMTDGSLLIMPNGDYLRTMNVRDGYALQLAVKKGYRVIVMSGATSVAVEERMRYLGIENVYMGIKGKKEYLHGLLSIEERQYLLFMGDDMPDIDLLRDAFLPCCPGDAAIEAITASAYISPFNGGKGCVRDVIEKVMKLQGKWFDEGQTAAI
jgi:3-deoxy-D-manno-octulosonate 8-phosphate phosphatase (KDO 8-P phosphatase)